MVTGRDRGRPRNFGPAVPVWTAPRGSPSRRGAPLDTERSLATIGSHLTYVLLPGGASIARVTRMKSWARCERFPLVLGEVCALTVLALAFAHVAPWWVAAIALLIALVPNPIRITTEVLPPIDVAAETAHIADPTARIEAAHALVHGALVRAVASMRHEAPAPMRRPAQRAL